jgi:hypothetical protein
LYSLFLPGTSTHNKKSLYFYSDKNWPRAGGVINRILLLFVTFLALFLRSLRAFPLTLLLLIFQMLSGYLIVIALSGDRLAVDISLRVRFYLTYSTSKHVLFVYVLFPL